MNESHIPNFSRPILTGRKDVHLLICDPEVGFDLHELDALAEKFPNPIVTPSQLNAVLPAFTTYPNLAERLLNALGGEQGRLRLDYWIRFLSAISYGFFDILVPIAFQIIANGRSHIFPRDTLQVAKESQQMLKEAKQFLPFESVDDPDDLVIDLFYLAIPADKRTHHQRKITDYGISLSQFEQRALNFPSLSRCFGLFDYIYSDVIYPAESKRSPTQSLAGYLVRKSKKLEKKNNRVHVSVAYGVVAFTGKHPRCIPLLQTYIWATQDGKVVVCPKSAKFASPHVTFIAENYEEAVNYVSVMRSHARGGNRFRSFAPIRENISAQWFVNGRDYFAQLLKDISMATDQIFIAGWWVAPELHLTVDDPPLYEHSLLGALVERANRGVKVYILLWNETTTGYNLGSHHSKHKFAEHANIQCIRHPTVAPLAWSHHEKICVFDQKIGFTGGIDLGFWRYDDTNYRLADTEGHKFPGLEYSNPSFGDADYSKHSEDNVADRTQTPRMPWHDIAVRVTGMAAFDIASSFMQRWNFSASHVFHSNTYHRLTPNPPFPVLIQPTTTPTSNPEPTPPRPIFKFPFPTGFVSSGLGILYDPDTAQNLYLGVSHSQAGGFSEKSLSMETSQVVKDVLPKESVQPKENSTSKVLSAAEIAAQYIASASVENSNGNETLIEHSSAPSIQLPSSYSHRSTITSTSVTALVNINPMGTSTVDVNSTQLFPLMSLQTNPIGPFSSASTIALRPSPVSTPSIGYPGVKTQVLRNMGTWSHGQEDENSYYRAITHVIRTAEKYVYIQNQFLISSTLAHKPINKIAQTIVSRIARAYKNNETFRVFVLLPVHVADQLKFLYSRSVVKWTRHTIKSILQGIVRLCPNADPFDYISFNSLRNWERSGDLIFTEQIYVHSKLVLVDDRTCIIGSANLNDRSLVPSRDSEVGVILHPPLDIRILMDGQEWNASSFVYDLRMHLWKIHLGIYLTENQAHAEKFGRYSAATSLSLVRSNHDALLNRTISFTSFDADTVKSIIRDPASPITFNKIWRGFASENTRIYQEVFGKMIPENCAKVRDQLKGSLKCDPDVLTMLSKVRGFLIEFPFEMCSEEKGVILNILNRRLKANLVM